MTTTKVTRRIEKCAVVKVRQVVRVGDPVRLAPPGLSDQVVVVEVCGVPEAIGYAETSSSAGGESVAVSLTQAGEQVFKEAAFAARGRRRLYLEERLRGRTITKVEWGEGTAPCEWDGEITALVLDDGSRVCFDASDQVGVSSVWLSVEP